MPTITVDDGCPIHVEVAGSDSAPALMLSNSLGTDLTMWDDQASAFAEHFRLIRYDRRGHGQSGAPKGPYSFDRFGRDILGVLDALGVKKTNWCGLSMGGMDGQWLGANAPDRVERLVLANTHYHYADKAPWADRLRFLEQHPLSDLVAANMERWFTKGFRERDPQAIARMTKMFVATDHDGYAACVAAVRDIDFRASNPTIRCRPWSSSARRIRRRRRLPARQSPRPFPAPGLSRSTPRTSPMSSSRRPSPRPCSISCRLAVIPDAAQRRSGIHTPQQSTGASALIPLVCCEIWIPGSRLQRAPE